MKEELTTLMHMEFCKDEWEAMELRIMEVTAVHERGGDVDAALKKMGLTREEYNKNVDAVFNLTKRGIDPKESFI
jgi:ACT domain-containing protein